MPKTDCGVYAIANIVSILHDIDPSSVSFNVSVMLRHLQQGLENKKITVFPHCKKLVLKVTGIPIFCQCRMPEHGFTFTCTECKKWFHPLAVNLSPKLNAKFDREK